jgi:hypothetical protein
MMRRQRGMISVERRKLMTSELSFCLTRAPMTPSEVSRRYSKGRVLGVVLRDVRGEEESAGVVVRGDALQQRQGVADPVGGVDRQRGRAQQRINGDDLLQQGRHDACVEASLVVA